MYFIRKILLVIIFRGSTSKNRIVFYQGLFFITVIDKKYIIFKL